ncbi:Hypothetical predicted protein, partial [Pelobates cultripes]
TPPAGYAVHVVARSPGLPAESPHRDTGILRDPWQREEQYRNCYFERANKLKTQEMLQMALDLKMTQKKSIPTGDVVRSFFKPTYLSNVLTEIRRSHVHANRIITLPLSLRTQAWKNCNDTLYPDSEVRYGQETDGNTRDCAL